MDVNAQASHENHRTWFLQHYPIPEVVFAGSEHYQREADGFPLKKQQMGVIIVCQILLFLMEAKKRWKAI